MDKHEKVLDLLAVVAEGVDRNITSSGARLAAAIVYLHAETDTIRTALRHLTDKQLAKSTLYVCRIKHQDGPGTPLTWGLSKPCPGCQRAIATFDIKNVVYSDEGKGAYNFL